MFYNCSKPYILIIFPRCTPILEFRSVFSFLFNFVCYILIDCYSIFHHHYYNFVYILFVADHEPITISQLLQSVSISVFILCEMLLVLYVCIVSVCAELN